MMVMTGEVDHHRRLTRHLRRRQQPVVTVEGQAVRERKAEAQSERRHDPSQRTQAGVPLPYVVEEGGTDEIRPARESRQDVQRRFEAVTLIGDGLRKVGLQQRRVPHPPAHRLGFSPTQRT